MIEYFRELFSKPKVFWNALDVLALTGLIVGVIIIVCTVYWIGFWVYSKIKEKEKTNAKNKRQHRP